MNHVLSPEERRLIKTIMNQPFLSVEREHILLDKWCNHQDERALHELINAYMRLVVARAGSFKHYGFPMCDLIQEGSIGLLKAAFRFDPDRDVRFSTYARWWVHSSLQDFTLRNWSIVRVGTTAAHKKLFFNLRRLRSKINDTGGDPMKRESIVWVAEHLGLKTSDVEAMSARVFQADRSLNTPHMTKDNSSSRQLQDILPDPAESVEESVTRNRDNMRRSKWIQSALKVLDSREAEIIRERIFAEQKITLAALGQKLGISKQRVSQLESQALKKLKGALVSLANEPEMLGLIPDS